MENRRSFFKTTVLIFPLPNPPHKGEGTKICNFCYNIIKEILNMYLLFRIIINALGVMLAASVVPGITVSSFWTAVLVAIVLGILNVTLGFVLKIITFPLSIITFGIFLLVINALMFKLSSFIKGFEVHGFLAAFFGAFIVTIVSMAGKQLIKTKI
jgi:putative membrane protein